LLGSGSYSTISKYRAEILTAEDAARKPQPLATPDAVADLERMLRQYGESTKLQEHVAKIADLESQIRELESEVSRLETHLLAEKDGRAEERREAEARAVRDRDEIQRLTGQLATSATTSERILILLEKLQQQK
jgi:TolA-binding protein